MSRPAMAVSVRLQKVYVKRRREHFIVSVDNLHDARINSFDAAARKRGRRQSPRF